MSKIFGGKSSSQVQDNKAFGDIKNAFSGGMQNFGTGASALGALLGGDSSGFNAYKDATGFDAMSEAGSRGITGNKAASGLLRSGSTGMALQNYGNQMQDQFAGNYMDRLLGQANLGLGAGGLMAQAGQQSVSKSKDKPGLGGFLGQMGAGIAASDRRLKKNIHKIAEMDNGLNVYQYRYTNDDGPHIGVMADEVALIQPEALGPVVDGYMTVDYGKLEGVA
jgi:hypothetical protein